MYLISKLYVHLLGNAIDETSSNYKTPPPILLDNDEYVSELSVYEWINTLVGLSGNPDLGLKAYHNTHPAMLGTLGYALMSSATLGAALEHIVLYQELISNGFCLKLEIEGENMRLIGCEIAIKAPRAYIDSGFSVIFSLLQWLVPQYSIKPLAVEFAYPEPTELGCLKAIFGEKIHFSATSNNLLFSKIIYNLPVISASSKLNIFHTEILKQQLEKTVNGSMQAKVRTIITEEFWSGSSATLQSVSLRLQISSRTLQYALQNEGVTFTTVFDSARKFMAHNLLQNSTRNLKSVAATLGFREKSSFHKASLRWFGVTPSKYRDSTDNS